MNPRSVRSWRPFACLTLLAVLIPSVTAATPSTTYWAPSTPYVQPFGVLHVTYDTYFNARASYPIDAGLTLGILPSKGFQAEAGFDFQYPSFASGEPIEEPIVLNGKVGAPEDSYFKGQPAWSFGIFGTGLKKHVNDQNALYGVIGKTVPKLGFFSAGGYYGLNKDLFLSATGDEERSGLLASWNSPTFDVPVIDKMSLAWDIQTGHNSLGATGTGAYLYFTPSISLLTGPVFFFEKELQPGGSDFMWTLQLDIDLDLKSTKGH